MIDLIRERCAEADWMKPAGMNNYDPDKLWTWRRIVSRDDCPHLLTEPMQVKRRAMEEKYGRNSAFIRSMVYGEFVSSGSDDAIFEDRHISLMLRAMRGEFRPVNGDIRFSGDVSGGGDKMVLMGRQGSEVVMIHVEDGHNEIEMADHWHRILLRLDVQPSQFVVDGGGIGATVAKYMEVRLDYWGIVRFMANKGPHDDVAFKDRYTELHWVVRELLENEVLKVPFCQGLLDDMRQRRYVVMDGDKIKAEPKKDHRKRTGRSPDHLDTLVYLLADFPIEEIRGKQATAQIKRDGADELTAMERDALAAVELKGGAFDGLPTCPDLPKLNLSFSLSRS